MMSRRRSLLLQAAAGGGFEPTDITGCTLWLDATDASTFTFSSGTLVSEWRDKSGGSRHVSQGTTANQPSRSGTIGGLTAVDFDGTNDILGSAIDQFVNASTGWWTAFVVLNADSVTAGQAFDSDGNTPNRVAQFLRVNSGKVESISFAVGGIGPATDNTGSVSSGVDYLLSAVRRSAAIEALVVGETPTSATSTTTNGNNQTNAVSVGGSLRSGGSGFFNGRIGEVILYGDALGTTDQQTVETYLTTKWGL